MKLELKHLAGYLPYGLKITKEDWGKIFKMDNDGTTLNCIGIDYILNVNAKPILRPLLDLTKEIEVNREKFVPYIELAKKYAEISGYNEDIRIFRNKCYCYSESSEIEFRFNGRDFILNGKLVNAQHHLFLKLHEWHFDIYGLIEKGLAIDINTINK